MPVERLAGISELNSRIIWLRSGGSIPRRNRAKRADSSLFAAQILLARSRSMHRGVERTAGFRIVAAYWFGGRPMAGFGASGRTGAGCGMT